MSENSRFWNATINELGKGFVYEQSIDEYICLMCNQSFENGVIYPIDNVLYEAKKAIEHHIKEVHHSTFDYLIQMDKKYTGLSDHQKELLQSFKNGISDKDIASEIGGSSSTIRNHRFKFREKEKQAKVFLAIMNLLKTEEIRKDNLIDIHKGARMVDERYAITVEEKEKVLSTYFDKGLDGTLKTFPSKEKRKIIVLQHMLKHFERKTVYSEKEVNEILKKIYSDFVTIRRYFIEYGFMERNKDGSKYWVSN